jgi:hypothetical protein
MCSGVGWVEWPLVLVAPAGLLNVSVLMIEDLKMIANVQVTRIIH